MNTMWEAIEIDKWKEVPCISGRIATEEDVKAGKAVFYIPSGSEHYDTELPLFALQSVEDTKVKVPCIVIQIEITTEGTVVGVRYIEGGNGVGMANEFEFYSEIPSKINL